MHNYLPHGWLLGARCIWVNHQQCVVPFASGDVCGDVGCLGRGFGFHLYHTQTQHATTMEGVIVWNGLSKWNYSHTCGMPNTGGAKLNNWVQKCQRQKQQTVSATFHGWWPNSCTPHQLQRETYLCPAIDENVTVLYCQRDGRLKRLKDTL